MNNKILLSICIPTYNRAYYLKNCLNSIVCQLKDGKASSQIEIVISDNASQDNTQELIKEYQARFSNIKYFRNKKNIGFDENLINSVLKAKGKYCWFLGDDDLIKNGSLEFINDFLQRNELALLTVDFYPFVDIQKALQKNKEINEKYISYFDSYEDFYLKGYCEGILGIFIVNKNLWLKMDKQNYEKLWSYYGMILRMMPLSNLKFAHLKYPVLFVGQDYKWNKNGEELLTLIRYKRILNSLTDSGYSKEFINREVKIAVKGLPITLLKAKGNNLKCSFSNLSLIYREFYKYPFYLFFAIVIFFIPNFLIKVLRFFKKIKK